MSRFIKKISTLIIVIGLIITVSACEKKEVNSSLSKPLETWSSSLITKVPTNAFGLIYWNTKKTAYEKYLTSNWNVNNSKIFKNGLANANPFLKNFLEILQKSGYSSEDSTWSEIFAENVLFASTESPDDNLYFGLLIKGQDKRNLEKFIGALKQAILEDGSLKLVPFTSQNPNAFGIELTDEANKSAAKTLYFTWQDDVAIIASSSKDLDTILTNDKKDLPAILKSEDYKKATKGMPDSKDVFSFIYLDLNVLKNLVLPSLKHNSIERLAKLPFSVLALAVSMNQELGYDLRCLNNGLPESQSQVSSILFQSSMENSLKATCSNPLVVLSYDGTTIKTVLESIFSLSELETNNIIFESIQKILTNLKRLSLVGQTAIPMPQTMLVLESPAAEKETEQVKKVISTLMSATGSPHTWQRTTFDKHQIDYINTSMMGLGIYVYTMGDSLTLVASSENIIKSAILASNVKDFTANLSKNAKTIYAKDKNVMNLYFDFEEVASVMEKFGGMIGMFMPNDPKLKEMFEPKELEKIRHFGGFVLSVSVEEDQSIRLKAAYTKK
ncbi:MAG: hypothetical protein LBE20_05895 [Deltaproteobacteria bacterium]|jgi:hypothetical protein|nr:hypothetical protein [Deltaproteobacteria bacterium]